MREVLANLRGRDPGGNGQLLGGGHHGAPRGHPTERLEIPRQPADRGLGDRPIPHGRDDRMLMRGSLAEIRDAFTSARARSAGHLSSQQAGEPSGVDGDLEGLLSVDIDHRDPDPVLELEILVGLDVDLLELEPTAPRDRTLAATCRGGITGASTDTLGIWAMERPAQEHGEANG